MFRFRKSAARDAQHDGVALLLTGARHEAEVGSAV